MQIAGCLLLLGSLVHQQLCQQRAMPVSDACPQRKKHGLPHCLTFLLTSDGEPYTFLSLRSNIHCLILALGKKKKKTPLLMSLSSVSIQVELCICVGVLTISRKLPSQELNSQPCRNPNSTVYSRCPGPPREGTDYISFPFDLTGISKKSLCGH